MDIILKPFAWLLLAFYNLTGSYAMALVLFTLVIKVVLFPLSIKGKRSMMKMTSLQGKMKQLEKQYGRDKQRYQEEIQRLYEREKVNPMGGCLWSLLPFPILMGLYGIIRRPLYYLVGLTNGQVETVTEAVTAAGATLVGNSGYHEIMVADLLNQPHYMEAAQAALGDVGANLFTLDFNFLGINLANVPNWKIWEGPFDWPTIGLFLIPILVTVLNVLSSRVSMKTNSFNKESNAAADATNRQMMILMPLMYLWFGFLMPGGMCIYMAANAIFMMLQDLICARILRKEYAELAAKQEEQARLEKEEEKRLKEERRLQHLKEAEEAKKNRGKKKPADPNKKKNPTNEAGRVGIRAYARGRSYDPDRFGGVTPYHDPDHPVDEEAVEAALAAKADKKAEKAAAAEISEAAVEAAVTEADSPAEQEAAVEENAYEGEYAPEAEETSLDEEK